MALDAEVGGLSANSYQTLAEATAYHDDRPTAAAWAAVSGPEAWLISAAERMEQLTYSGRRTDEDQALSFPRYGVIVDGILLDPDIIPPRIQYAQAKLALLLSQLDSPLADTGLEGFERLKIDVLEIEPREGFKAGNLPEEIQRELAPFLAGGSVYQFRRARG